MRGLLLVLALLALPAAAATPEERLAALNAYLQQGYAALNMPWASTPPQEQALRINSAQDVSTTVKKQLTPDLQGSPFYPPLAKSLATLDEQIAESRIANTSYFARQQALEALGRRDEAVARAALDGFAANLNKLKSVKRLADLYKALEGDKKAIEKNLQALQKALAEESMLRATAEAEVRRKAEANEKARLKAEAEALVAARLKAEAAEKLRLKAEADAKKLSEADEKARAKAEADAKKLAAADEKARAKAEAEAKKKAEADEQLALKAAADAKKKAEAEEKARLKAEEDAKKLSDAEEKKRAEAEAKKQAEEAKLRDRNDPVRLAALSREARVRLEEHLRDKTSAPLAKELAAASVAVAEVKRVDAARGEVERVLLDNILLRAFARQPAGSVVKPPLDAKVLRTMGATAKPTTFDVWADWCYAFVSSSEAAFRGAIDVPFPVIRFRQSTTSSSQLAGFCSGQAGSATLSVTQDVGAKATVSLLGWPREKLPLAVSLHAALVDFDACNEGALDLAWSDVLPGTVAFVAAGDAPAGPALIVDPAAGRETSLRVLTADGVERTVLKGALSGENVRAPLPGVPPEQCAALGAPLVEKADPVACRKASDDISRPVLEKLISRLAAAPSDSDRALVEREVRTLDDESARRRSIDCAPISVSRARVFRVRHHQSVLARTIKNQRPQLLATEAAP